MSENQDFLQPLLDLMNKRMDTMENKIDANSATTEKVLEQARYTNGRVTKAEANITALQKQAGRKLNLQPNLLYLIATGGIILLAIIAQLLHISLGGLIK